MFKRFLSACLILAAAARPAVETDLTTRQQKKGSQIWYPSTGPNLEDIQYFYQPGPSGHYDSSGETPLSVSVGAALWAMTKCNDGWPQQLFNEVGKDDEDSGIYNITLYHPISLKAFEPITMRFDDAHNINPELKTHVGNALEKQWDRFKDSDEGRQYSDDLKKYQPVQGKNLVESHFVMSALFQRKIVVTQTESPTEFGDITKHANGSPMIYMRSPGESEISSTAVMRQTEPPQEHGALPTVWFGSPQRDLNEPEQESRMTLDPDRKYPQLTLVHLLDLEEAFNGASWYHD